MARRHADLAAAKQPVAPSAEPGPDPPQRASFNMEPTWLQVLQEEVEADEISSAQLMEDLAAEKRLSKLLAAEDHLAQGVPPPGPIDHVSGAAAWASTSVELTEPSPIQSSSEVENPNEKDAADRGTVTASTAAEEEAPSQGFKQVSAADLAALGFQEPPSPASQSGDDAVGAWLQLLEDEVDASCKATAQLLAEDGGAACMEERGADLFAEDGVPTGPRDIPRDVPVDAPRDVPRDAAAQDDLPQAPHSPNLPPSPPLDDSDDEDYYENRCETPRKPGWRIRLEAQLAEKEKEFGEKPRNSMEVEAKLQQMQKDDIVLKQMRGTVASMK